MVQETDVSLVFTRIAFVAVAKTMYSVLAAD